MDDSEDISERPYNSIAFSLMGLGDDSRPVESVDIDNRPVYHWFKR